MKFTSVIALMLLTESVSTVKIAKELSSIEPVSSGLLQTSIKSMVGDFDSDVPNLYDDSLVTELDPDTVEDMIGGPQKNHLNGNPNFLLSYHPQCPHCAAMVGEFKAFAQLVKKNKIPINIQAINLSKSDDDNDLEELLDIK